MALQDAGKVKYIGVSNSYDVSLLEALEADGGRRVQVVQNRWFEGNGWDAEVLAYCRKHGIQYQSFWTLTGSPSLLSHPLMKSFAEAKGCTPAQAVYRLAQHHGITPLSGTSNEEHMRADIAVEEIVVDAKDKKIVLEVAKWMGIKD
ncbi:hypothetical protein PHLCEN_2v9235 [Hermanssonia centrifuga]|uniref:NADP-dependent oxidoreductase domain-containing protein n=1 Tax=Hermanssonia centrifuga TaxID=98765 RepID=A0A2R6NRH6_9APHY|nr:hypothetical protein PHLCEN_2v9235 [Hermanssonia centrifuga]